MGACSGAATVSGAQCGPDTAEALHPTPPEPLPTSTARGGICPAGGSLTLAFFRSSTAAACSSGLVPNTCGQQVWSPGAFEAGQLPSRGFTGWGSAQQEERGLSTCWFVFLPFSACLSILLCVNPTSVCLSFPMFFGAVSSVCSSVWMCLCVHLPGHACQPVCVCLCTCVCRYVGQLCVSLRRQ